MISPKAAHGKRLALPPPVAAVALVADPAGRDEQHHQRVGDQPGAEPLALELRQPVDERGHRQLRDRRDEHRDGQPARPRRRARKPPLRRAIGRRRSGSRPVGCGRRSRPARRPRARCRPRQLHDHRRRWRCRVQPAPTSAPRPTTESRTTAPSPTTAPSISTLPCTSAPAATTAARTHRRTAVDHRRRVDASAPGQHQRLPRLPGQRGRPEPPEHEVARPAHERRGCADVEPVRRVDVAEQERARAQQAGERLALHRHRAPGRDRVDDAAAEDVATGVDPGW